MRFSWFLVLFVAKTATGVAVFGDSTHHRAPESCTTISFAEGGNEEDRWEATVKVKVLERINGVWIKVDLDRKADVLITDFGETTSTNNQNFMIRRPDLSFSPGETIKVKLIVKFSGVGSIPNISKIIVNGRIICPPAPSPPMDIDVRVQDSNKKIIGKEGCGVVPETESLIFNGDLSSEGAWPWHVAIMKINPPRVDYSCGGSIVSENFILTAAHCVTFPRTSTLVGTQTLLLYIGVTRLTDLGIPSVKIFTADELFIPEDYSAETYFNDIALIKLSGNLQFNNFIRPICLWSEDTDQSTVTGRLGTVVGWGIDHRNRSFSTDLRHAEIPIVSFQTCRERGDFYKKHTNEKTYCAGGEGGKSVCNGDSGGGMIFKNGAANKSFWQIRGVVSLNQKQDLNQVCNTKNYAIFTDVAKHLEWIRKIVNL